MAAQGLGHAQAAGLQQGLCEEPCETMWRDKGEGTLRSRIHPCLTVRHDRLFHIVSCLFLDGELEINNIHPDFFTGVVQIFLNFMYVEKYNHFKFSCKYRLIFLLLLSGPDLHF